MSAPRTSTAPVREAAAPALRTAVETIPGVFSLDGYFDALFALATRVEGEQPSLTTTRAA